MNPKTGNSILVVDDDAGIRLTLEKYLADWNFEVLAAENGRQAIKIIDSERPDLVITDLFMPEMDGFELLRSIQEKKTELPVIVISGQGRIGDVIRALRLGAWDYLYKPIEKASFLQLAIERALEKGRLIQENRNYRDHLEEMVARKKSELAANEKRYRIVADFTYNWEFWLSPEGKVVYMSPSCERISGYPADAFVANPPMLQEIIHPEDRCLFDGHLNNSCMQKPVCNRDFRIIRNDGEHRWIHHTCLPIYDDGGNYGGRRCSHGDITYQKKIENNLKEQQQELIQKTIGQEKANEALKALLDQRDTEKKAIEQSMVTNLKRFVFPYLDILEKHKIDQEVRTYVNIIRTNIEQLVSPVSQSLSGAYLKMTPMERKVADLIRQGRSTKSVAAILKTSPSTVEKHRNKIRKKLNILHKNINLYVYLNSLA